MATVQENTRSEDRNVVRTSVNQPQPARRTLLKSAVAGMAIGSVATVTAGTGAVAAAPRLPRVGRTREYWIQVDNITWNVVPNGRDEMMGMTFSADQTTYTALGYRAYTHNWGKPLPGGDDIGPNNGVPGPIIRGRVGDTIVIHFRNNDQKYNNPYSIHPHGVQYGPDSDGSWMAADPDRRGTAVAPGETYTYTWKCPTTSPGTWVYHDHSKPMPNQAVQADDRAPVMELAVMMGLYGFIVVTDDTYRPVDREFFLFMSEFWSTYMPVRVDMMGFNGYAFVDNTPTVRARAGERVRWHIGALGQLPHVFHVHGHRWWNGQRFVDSQDIQASETLVLEWDEDNPGDWLYHCHYSDHFAMGMAGRYVVSA